MGARPGRRRHRQLSIGRGGAARKVVDLLLSASTWRAETEGKSSRHCAHVRTRDRTGLVLLVSAVKGGQGCKQAGRSVLMRIMVWAPVSFLALHVFTYMSIECSL